MFPVRDNHKDRHAVHKEHFESEITVKNVNERGQREDRQEQVPTQGARDGRQEQKCSDDFAAREHEVNPLQRAFCRQRLQSRGSAPKEQHRLKQKHQAQAPSKFRDRKLLQPLIHWLCFSFSAGWRGRTSIRRWLALESRSRP